ncbi:hypothetical protein Hanom_Chr01g00029231 [Helianthus anomalus]
MMMTLDDDDAGALAELVRGAGWSCFVRLENPQNGKVGSVFFGPGQSWSSPNRCLRQWSMVQSRHLIVLENVRISLQPRTGHFFFLVAFS